ncbi:MAG: S53 family peptidase [Mycobacterium sp.]
MQRSRAVLAASLTAVAVAGILLGADRPWDPEPARNIDGPYARLLSDSTDLGPAREPRIQLTVALRDDDEPVRLNSWAQLHELSVRWRQGDDWAILEGAPAAIADALGVVVHDYRSPKGVLFYASPQQPTVPSAAHDEVAEFGRILSYTDPRQGLPPTPPRDVPDGGLLPTQVSKAYGADELTKSGYTGRGQTVVVFSFDGFRQADMDTFAEWFNVPKFTPEVVGGMPAQITGESTMDLQVIHAVAPDARLVMVNARPTVESGGTFERLGTLMKSVDQQFPGAIWSLSIGWGCDRLFTAADLAPVRSAIATAHQHGTTVFDATGDLAGLECKGGHNWSDPPSPDDVGVDAVASIPEITAVGGTTLSTDAQGGYLAEQGWYDVPLTQGSAGGASTLFGRPSWQATGSGGASKARRMVPDVAAVADPFTGVKFVLLQQVTVGGGTSQATPVWAGLAAVMNQVLKEQGADPLGDLNPYLYAVAKGSAAPAFRDIQLGGNAITVPHAGYDMVTGLGSPHVLNLLKGILLVRSANR